MKAVTESYRSQRAKSERKKQDHSHHSVAHLEKPSSSPNVAAAPERDPIRRLYSLSLSQLRKHSDFAEYHFKMSPFNLRWVYGYNQRAGIINLNKKGSTVAFYAASNCGILYNWSMNQMRILQGHRNLVTCIASDVKGKWLVTADSGNDNVIIIWDSDDYFPQRTIFSPHGHQKLAKVALSADAKYLLTVGYAERAMLHWWIWSFKSDLPHVKKEVEIRSDTILTMDFHPDKSERFLLLTKKDIWVGEAMKIFATERGVLRETDDWEIKIRKVDKKMGSDLGRLTCFTFVNNTSQILVGTSRGGVLVYGYTLQYQPQSVHSGIDNIKFIKVLKIEKHKINVIKSIDNVIVTGNCVGEIRFYDHQMKLIYWVHGFTVDTVRGISFNISPRSYKVFDPECNKMCICLEDLEMPPDPESGETPQKLLKKTIPTDATTSGKPFLVRDFILCTNNQGIQFVDFANESLSLLLDYRTSYVLSITVHPEKTLICVGNQDGTLELLDFNSHSLLIRLDLRDHYKVIIPPKDDSIKCNVEITIPHLSVTCVKYSPSGLHLACGLNTGQLLFLDPTTIDIVTKPPFKDTKFAIKDICYSCDSLTLAFSDAGKTVCVYKYNCNTFRWSFIGKHRAHYKDITQVFFLPRKNDDGEWKLLSLGADRIMTEYDIGSSSEEYLEILSLDRMDQTAIPLGAMLWPTPADVDPEECFKDLPMIIVANDEFKFKIINYDTTMTLSTILGPRYEHPVSKMLMITKKEDKEPYILFATKYTIGIQKLPLDGNPWKHVAMLGHPIQVTTMCFRDDLSTLFSIGSRDSCMSQWAANFRSVDHTSKQGGTDLDPYYCLIENGRPGWLFQEIRDLFYYIQILCQGTFSPAMRRVKDYIPIDSLPDLMRALGYFPSEYEVENLLIEAKYKIYRKQPVSEIDFEEFVRLYLNHRPAFGDNIKKIRTAFKTFAKCRREEYFIMRDDFIDILYDYGEHFSNELSWYLLSILSGQSFEDRAQQPDDDYSFLPEKLKFHDLVTAIMGLRDYDTTDQVSVMSYGSVPQSASSEESEDRAGF